MERRHEGKMQNTPQPGLQHLLYYGTRRAHIQYVPDSGDKDTQAQARVIGEYCMIYVSRLRFALLLCQGQTQSLGMFNDTHNHSPKIPHLRGK